MSDLLYEEIIDNIITNLKILSMVQKNEKLCIRKGYLQIDKVSKFQFLKRFLFNDSRDNTLIYLKQLIRNIKMILETKRDLVIDDFDNIVMGINNLKITYSDDPMIIASFDHIVTKLKKLIN
jgi:hypothetical protein